MLKGFRDFILRGNVVDLAVAVVIGVAFAAVVSALLNGLITPLIAAIFSQPNVNSVGTFTINLAAFSIGLVLTAIINFVIVAGAIYFIVVLPLNKIMARRKSTDEEAAEEIAEEIALLREIRDSLKSREA